MVELSKRYLTQLSCGLSDPRVKVHIQDGAEFVAQHRDKFDVIITDSPDDKGQGGSPLGNCAHCMIIIMYIHVHYN